MPDILSLVTIFYRRVYGRQETRKKEISRPENGSNSSRIILQGAGEREKTYIEESIRLRPDFLTRISPQSYIRRGKSCSERSYKGSGKGASWNL